MWGEFGCYVYERKCEQDRNCLLRSMTQALFPIPSLQRKPFSSEFRFPERHNFVNIEWHALFALNTSSLVHHTRRLNRQVEPRQTLLSSITVFSDSIHIGSMSPSSTIHLGLSLWISERSRIVVEKRPAKNICEYTPLDLITNIMQLWTTLLPAAQNVFFCDSLNRKFVNHQTRGTIHNEQ